MQGEGRAMGIFLNRLNVWGRLFTVLDGFISANRPPPPGGRTGRSCAYSQLITNFPGAPDENSRYASGASSIVDREVMTDASGTFLSAV